MMIKGFFYVGIESYNEYEIWFLFGESLLFNWGDKFFLLCKI